MWASILCASQMDVYRLFFCNFIATHINSMWDQARSCMSMLSAICPVQLPWRCTLCERGASIKTFSCHSFLGVRFPMELILQGKAPFSLESQNTAMFDSFRMLEFEQNVLTWNGSNICTCWKKSKHFAAHFFDIKWLLPVELWCLMGDVVWMHYAYSSFVDWAACLKYISNSMRQICSEWAEQCRVKVREQPDIMEDQFQYRRKQGYRSIQYNMKWNVWF